MKDNIPNGSLFPPELRETVKRIREKEPELELLVEAGQDQHEEALKGGRDAENPRTNPGGDGKPTS